MLKRTSSSYGVGRQRGDWWKWKSIRWSSTLCSSTRNPATDGARPSTPITLLGCGMKASWSRWRKRIPAERRGDSRSRCLRPRQYDRKVRPIRAVRPELVFELAFEGVQRSSRHKAGIAVRFPRMNRWRRDNQRSRLIPSPAFWPAARTPTINMSDRWARRRLLGLVLIVRRAVVAQACRPADSGVRCGGDYQVEPARAIGVFSRPVDFRNRAISTMRSMSRGRSSRQSAPGSSETSGFQSASRYSRIPCSSPSFEECDHCGIEHHEGGTVSVLDQSSPEHGAGRGLSFVAENQKTQRIGVLFVGCPDAFQQVFARRVSELVRWCGCKFRSASISARNRVSQVSKVGSASFMRFLFGEGAASESAQSPCKAWPSLGK